MQIDASDLPVISGQTWCLCYKWNSTFISVYCNRQMVTFPNTKAVYFLILFLLARWKIVPILVHRAYAITEMIMLQSYFLLYPNNLWSSCIYLFLVGEVLWIPLSQNSYFTFSFHFFCFPSVCWKLFSTENWSLFCSINLEAQEYLRQGTDSGDISSFIVAGVRLS